MTHRENSSTYNVTANDTLSSPSLNSLPTSESHLNGDNVQTHAGIYDQQGHDQDLTSNGGNPISKEEDALSPRLNHDSSIEDILLPRVSREQSEKLCTHILLQKNEKPEELVNILDNAVSEYACRSDKASQNYKVHIKNEPTTIVITRRGSTNSITAVGSCARFRGGGSDKERSGRRKKSKKGSKLSGIWKHRSSDRTLSSTSADSATSSGSSKGSVSRSSKKDSYFKRMSSRQSEGSDKHRPRSRRSSSSPKPDLGQEEIKSKISKAFVHNDRRYLGPGHSITDGGDEEENVNKSEGPNKRESRSKSLASKPKPKARKSSSKSPKRKQSTSGKPSRTRTDTVSEPLYVKEEVKDVASPYTLTQKLATLEESSPKETQPPAATVQHKYIQTDRRSSPGRSSPGVDRTSPGVDRRSPGFETSPDTCCSCGMPTTHPGRPSPRKVVLCIRSDVMSTIAYDLDRPEGDSEQQPQDSAKPKITPAQEDQPPRQTPSSEKPVTEETQTEDQPLPEATQTPNPEVAVKEEAPPETQAAPEQKDEATSYSPSLAMSQQSSEVTPDKPATEEPTETEEERDKGKPAEPAHSSSSASRGRYGSGHEYRVKDHSPAPDTAKPEADSSKSSRESGANVHCDHCGCGLETVNEEAFKDRRKNKTPSQDNNVSHVLWALARVTVYKDGTRNFEILETTPIPPGHYLMPGNDEYMLVPVNR